MTNTDKTPSGDMLTSLQAWWDQHALALRMTSRSVHRAIGVALSALEQGKPFPMMQVLADVPEPTDQSERIAQLEAELLTRPAASEGLTELVRRLTHAQQKLERVRQWRNSDDGKYALPRITELDAILEEP